MKLAPEMREHICARVDWLIPFHLQIFFDELEELWREAKAAPDAPMVERAAAHVLCDPKAHVARFRRRAA